MGTESSKGTKIFSLAGRINNTGLVEVPIGLPLHEVIFKVGGGIPRGRQFKAVQMGGPSGGCVPMKYLNLPIDYGSLESVGAIMGSGGMVVMDRNTCMVDVARFFLSFTQTESCGKCVPCRLGTKRMFEILTRITKGEGREGDIELLEEVGQSVKDASLCGLGQTAANPVLSTIRHFREEYEAHIKSSGARPASAKPWSSHRARIRAPSSATRSATRLYWLRAGTKRPSASSGSQCRCPASAGGSATIPARRSASGGDR